MYQPDLGSFAMRGVLEGARVLLVNRSQGDRDWFAALLDEGGADVMTAETAGGAVAVFERDMPDLVISELASSEPATLELIRRIRRLPADRGGEVPVVALVGETGGMDRAHALAAGFSAHLTRPVHTGDLVATVSDLARSILHARASRARLAQQRQQNVALRERLRDRRQMITVQSERLRQLGRKLDARRLEAEAPARLGNRLLEALPHDERERIALHLQPIYLEQGETVCVPGRPLDAAVFPRSCVISMLCVVASGKTFEVTARGADGFLGLPVVLGSTRSPYWGLVTIGGDAWRIGATQFAGLLDECSALRRLLLRFAHAQLLEASQVAACTRAHAVPAQLARWLLTTSDRAGSTFFRLTHESISDRLGTRRASVSLAMEAFQRDGLLSTRSGRIRIDDRAGLEAVACECYRIIRGELASLFVDPH